MVSNGITEWQDMHLRDDARPSPLAGRWYPGDPRELARSIDEYLHQPEVASPAGEVMGVIAPHAGHAYSGSVAGAAFSVVPDDIEVVAVVSPLHQYYAAPVLTTAHRAYATPLGEIPVDRQALDRLRRSVPLEAVARDTEHSLEILLPFLQRRLRGDFRLLPLMLRDQSLATAERVAAALAGELADKRVLLVGSTDLSHFHPQREAERLDRFALDRIAAYDPHGLIEADASGRGPACGHGAAAAVILAAQRLGADRATVLAYATSGDITGDHASVVGYGAAALTRSG